MAERKQIGSLLVDAGIISTKTLERMLRLQKGSGKQLGALLSDMGLVTEEEIIEALARQCDIRTISHFADQAFPRELLDLVPAEMASEKLIFPLKLNRRTLVIAAHDPFDQTTFSDLANRTGLKIYLALATRDEIGRAARKHYPVRKARKSRGQKILLLEASPTTAKVLDAVLSAEHYEVMKAHDGIDGLKLAFSHHPDLIICDHAMQRLNGYTFMQALKAHPQTTDIPVLLASANDTDEEKHRALKAGFADFIAKPIMPLRLLAQIGNIFASRHPGRKPAFPRNQQTLP